MLIGYARVSTRDQATTTATAGLAYDFFRFLRRPLQARGIHFRSLTDGIDTGSPAGRFFFHIMASLAEMERDLIAERTRAGLDAAPQR